MGSNPTLSAIYPVLKRLSRRFSFVPINPPINSLGACIPSEVDYRPLPGISASALSWQQDRRPATADYLTSSSRAAGPHQRHAQGDRGGEGVGGMLGTGAGVCVWRYTPLLGAANFFKSWIRLAPAPRPPLGRDRGGMFGRPGLPIREPDDNGHASVPGGRGQSGSQQFQPCAFPREKLPGGYSKGRHHMTGKPGTHLVPSEYIYLHPASMPLPPQRYTLRIKSSQIKSILRLRSQWDAFIVQPFKVFNRQGLFHISEKLSL